MEEELELFKYSVKESKTPPLLENKARIFRLMNLLNKNKSSNRCLAIIEHMKNINQDECNNENDIRICNVMIMLNIRYINISIRIKKNIDRCYEMLENDIVYDPTPLKYYYKMQIMSYMDILQDSKSFFTTINDMKDSAKGWAVLANFDGKDIEDNNPIVKFLLQICGKIVLFDPFYADLSACIRNLKTQGWDSFNIILFYYDLIMPFTCCYPFLVDQIFSATIRMISLNKKPFHRRVLGHAYNCKKILICSDKETYIECRQLNYDNKLVHINESHDEFLSNIFDLYYSFVNLNTQPTVSLENESQPSLLDLALENQSSSYEKYMHCCKVYRTILTNVETTIRSLKNKINTCFLKIIYKRCLCGPKKIASKVMLELDFLHKLCLQFNEIKWEYTFIYVEWLIFKLKEIAKNALQCLGTSIGSPEFKAVLDECHIVTNLCQNYPSKSHTYRQTIYEIPPMGRKNLPKLTFSSVDARNDLNKVNDVYYDILLKERECIHNCDVSRVYELIRKFPINDVFLNIINANLEKVTNSITFRDESTYGNIKIQEVIPETLESNKTSLAKKSSSSEKFRDKWAKALRENVELEKQIKELKSKLKDTNKLSNKKDAIIGELKKKNSEGAKLHAFEKLQVKKLKKEKDTLSAELSEKQMEFVKIQDELEKYILLENKTRESCEYFKDVIDKSEQKKTILALEESLKQKCDKIASMELDIRDKDQKILSNCMLSQEIEILREIFNKLKIFHENYVKNLREINIKQNEYIEKHLSTKLDLDASEYKLLTNGSERTLDYFLQIVKILSKYKLKEVPNSNELGTESVATNNFKEIFANNIVRQKELYSSIQYTIENLRTLSCIDLRNKVNLFLLYECATNPNIYLKVFEEIANEYFKLFETVKQLCVNKNETKTTTDFVYPENSNTNNNSILSPYSWGSFHSEKSSSRNSICMPPFEPPTESKFSKAIGGPTPFAEKPIKTKKKSEDELSHWRPGGKYHIILKVIKESIPSCQDNVLMNVLIQVKGRNNNKLSNLTYDEIFKQAMDVFKEKLIPIPHDPCSICLEEFGNHLSKRLPCNHLFHRKCINGWLEANTCCPICKKHTTKMD